MRIAFTKDHKNKKLIFLVFTLIIVSNWPVFPLAQARTEEIIPFIVITASGPRKLDPVDAYDSKSIETIMQVCEGLYIYNYSSSEMESIPCLAENMGSWNNNNTELTIPFSSCN